MKQFNILIVLALTFICACERANVKAQNVNFEKKESNPTKEKKNIPTYTSNNTFKSVVTVKVEPRKYEPNTNYGPEELPFSIDKENQCTEY